MDSDGHLTMQGALSLHKDRFVPLPRDSAFSENIPEEDDDLNEDVSTPSQNCNSVHDSSSPNRLSPSPPSFRRRAQAALRPPTHVIAAASPSLA